MQSSFIIDLVLPVPSSIVMAASGLFLGPWIGGTVSFFGAMSAAIIGYLACRWGGQSVFKRLVGDEDLEQIDKWFLRYGTVAIILSRPVPMLTEILSCLAGLSAFRFTTFLSASILGTLPICYIYSIVGSRGDLSNPWPALIVALLIPAAGWGIAYRVKN